MTTSKLTPDIFEGLVNSRLDDKQATAMTTVARVILDMEGSTMDKFSKALEEARDNFLANYELLKSKVEQK